MKIKNKKGFTLIELMISTLLISMLAIVAISSYFNSTETFNFLATYKNIVSDLRMARSFAINNKTIANIQSERYGVCVTKGQITVFADKGNKPLSYEQPVGGPSCLPTPLNEPADEADKDSVIKTYSFPNYTISAYGSKEAHDLDQPLAILTGAAPSSVGFFYDKVTGNFTLTKDNREVVPKNSANKYVILKLAEGTKRTKYIVIFQVSGLPEEYDSLTLLQQ